MRREPQLSADILAWLPEARVLPGLAASNGFRLTVVEAPEPPAVDLRAATLRAVRRPAASPPLSELAANAGRVVIVTSDATRAVPSRGLLPVVLDELAAGGVGADAIDVVIGGGAHRACKADERERLLGPDLLSRVRVHDHDAHGSEFVDVGVTSLGTPVFVNRMVAEADLVVALGLVEPHEFAGFTGGRKAILPGVCAYATILANHSVAMLMHEGTRCGELNHNPVHRDMLEAADMAGLSFIVNVAVDSRLRPVAVAAGAHKEAHAELVDHVVRHNSVEVERPPDVVVTAPGPPLDVNLYQSVKALAAIVPLIGCDTSVVLASACREGLGPPEVLAAFKSTFTPHEMVERLSGDYCVEMNAALVLARFLEVCPRLHLHCGGLSRDEIAVMQCRPAPDLGATVHRLAESSRGHSSRPEIALVPRAQRLLLSATDG